MKFFLRIIIIIFITTIFSCDNLPSWEYDSVEYFITYDGNGAEESNYIDSNPKFEDSIATVYCYRSFTKENYYLTGWNTKADGSGVFYAEFDTFNMASKDLTLYAMWEYAIVIEGLFTLEENLTEFKLLSYSDLNSKSVEIPSAVKGKPVTSIENEAFKDFSNLEYVTIPDTVKYIGNKAFSGCTNLFEINLPGKLTSIEWDTFAECSGLYSINIPDSVNYLGNGAFRDCSLLTTISIPDSVESIPPNLFLNCDNLRSISINGEIDSIGFSAFNGCINLLDLYLHSLSAPTIPIGSLGNISSVTLHLSPNSTGYNVDPWTSTTLFSSIIEDL